MVLPRGGARELGRSCSQVDVGDRTYLVDCGIKQGYTTEYPLFRGLGPGAVDAVFLTHAHVDHIGALPVAEQRGLFADDAPIITTRPTNALAHTLARLTQNPQASKRRTRPDALLTYHHREHRSAQSEGDDKRVKENVAESL